MILRVYLRHTKLRGQTAFYDVFNFDANQASHIRQDYNKATLELYVQDTIKAKLPTTYYNYEVDDWELVDHRDHLANLPTNHHMRA
jgi:hypothetical protein